MAYKYWANQDTSGMFIPSVSTIEGEPDDRKHVGSRGPHQALRLRHRQRPGNPARRTRTGRRAPRPQRRRKNHDGLPDRGAPETRLRLHPSRRCRRRRRTGHGTPMRRTASPDPSTTGRPHPTHRHRDSRPTARNEPIPSRQGRPRHRRRTRHHRMVQPDGPTRRRWAVRRRPPPHRIRHGSRGTRPTGHPGRTHQRRRRGPPPPPMESRTPTRRRRRRSPPRHPQRRRSRTSRR